MYQTFLVYSYPLKKKSTTPQKMNLFLTTTRHEAKKNTRPRKMRSLSVFSRRPYLLRILRAWLMTEPIVLSSSWVLVKLCDPSTATRQSNNGWQDSAIHNIVNTSSVWPCRIWRYLMQAINYAESQEWISGHSNSVNLHTYYNDYM